MKYVSRIVFLIILFSVSIVLSGTTGKIAGRITDKQTGEPLPGVNVFLEGTTYGAATNEDGFYFILNVPPGYYTLKLSYVGYAEQEVNDVKVNIDLTSVINVEMIPELLETETVVIVAERPVVLQDISNSQLNIEAKTIETMPIQTVNEVLTLQAGIETGTNGIIVRGGGANQTVFMVDGLSLNDERSNYPYMAVTLSSVEEIQVQTGGFNAEYGQARSGVVNIVTKEGSRQKYNGTVTVRYAPAAPKHFGISVFDPMSYFNRPYFDPDVMWTGTQNGAWDSHMQAQYPKFQGWNAVADATLQNDNPNDDLTPEGAMRVFEWYRRRQGDIKKADYVLDFGFGGPVPFIGKDLGNLRFHLSHFQERDMFVIPLSTDHYGENYSQIKFNADINPRMSLMVSGLYGEVHSVSPYDWQTTPTGQLLSSQTSVAALPSSSNTGLSIPYMPGYFSPGSIYRNVYNIKFIHTLNPQTFYEVNLQYKHNRHNVHQTDLRDTTARYEVVPGYFVDEAPYGYWGYGSTGPAGVHLGGWMNLGRDKSINATTTFAFHLTSQVGKHNQIKTGLEYIYNDFDINSYTYSPSMDTWNRSMVYHIFPYRIGAYFQDKLEFSGFIANLGVRLDYLDSNTDSYQLSWFDPFYSQSLGGSIEEEAPAEDSEPDFAISPRLGISHPITAESKLYFNYGHFRSEPFSSYRFRIQRENAGNVKYIGNPNLSFEKTVAYELGYEHNISDILLVKIAGYYKDVVNQPGWIHYINLEETVNYYKAANNNYEDIRGFELTLTKRVGSWLTGFINYTYDVRTSGYFDLLQYWEDPGKQRDYLKERPEQTRREPRPYARANLDFHTPSEFGPTWLGMHPLGEWNLNILADWKTGAYETYNPYKKPEVVNDVQWKDWYNIDLRLSKMIRFDWASVQLYLDVTNLLNYKYMSEAGFADDYDRKDYLASLNFSWEEGVEKGDDRIGDYRPVGVEYDPLEPNPTNDPEIKARNDKRKEDKSYIDMTNITSLTFLNPRKITFGIRINF